MLGSLLAFYRGRASVSALMYMVRCTGMWHVNGCLMTDPVMSSWATAVRAIMTAVGFCICISRSSTFPSLVSLMSAVRMTSGV